MPPSKTITTINENQEVFIIKLIIMAISIVCIIKKNPILKGWNAEANKIVLQIISIRINLISSGSL